MNCDTKSTQFLLFRFCGVPVLCVWLTKREALGKRRAQWERGTFPLSPAGGSSSSGGVEGTPSGQQAWVWLQGCPTLWRHCWLSGTVPKPELRDSCRHGWSSFLHSGTALPHSWPVETQCVSLKPIVGLTLKCRRITFSLVSLPICTMSLPRLLDSIKKILDFSICRMIKLAN